MPLEKIATIIAAFIYHLWVAASWLGDEMGLEIGAVGSLTHVVFNLSGLSLARNNQTETCRNICSPINRLADADFAAAEGFCELEVEPSLVFLERVR